MSEKQPLVSKVEVPNNNLAKAKEHLNKVQMFLAKFAGKTGYNPYQWASDNGVDDALVKVDNQASLTEEELKVILAIPSNVEPKARPVHSYRVDEYNKKVLADRQNKKETKKLLI